LAPDFAEAHFNLGLALSESNDLYAAFRSYEQAAKLDPQLVQAHYNLGLTFLRIGQYLSAFGPLQRAFDLEISPDIALAYGFALTRRGAVEEAVSVYQAGLAAVGSLQARKRFVERIRAIHQDSPAWATEPVLASLNAYNQVVADAPISTQPAGAPEFRHELPTLPEGLSWPRPRLPGVAEAERTDDDYDRAPEYGKWRGLESYLRRVWEPLIPHIDMPTLRERWPRLGEAIDRQRRKLPADLLIPVKKQVTDRLAAAHAKPGDRPARVDWALRNRAYRARQKERGL
jgi:tetratricopeptide (TPR) repeat protein